MAPEIQWRTSTSKTCEVRSGDPSGDDASAILEAFEKCKEDGHILFTNTTYYVGRAMKTTGLKDVDIELQGTMEWSKDIDYWLNNSIPIGFQNQSAAWLLGGDNIRFYGHGYGTLFGNGDVWYVFNNGTSNLQGRPHAISIYNTTNSLVEGLRFIQSQMWTSTVMRSERVELSNIYVNNSCITQFDRCNVNTDGVDTIYANYITFLRWSVESGDDSISMKQNSSNIYMANNTFHRGLAYAMGSIGQYENQVNFIENITAIDTVFIDTAYAGRIKSWTGRNTGVPPNGGGGGLGWARNISFTNFTLQNVDTPWYITQCTSYNGVKGGCDTSLFHIDNMHWGNTTGTTKNNLVLSLQCSGAAPCTNINIFDNDLTVHKNGTTPTEFLCSNVDDPKGFKCTGKAPNTSG
ncbi:exo-polygalacturonase [Paraphaeosphaeria sporulosa]|uniref:Exo-polygalacturonase n=1 Tax=Paraphaeosphaeria sporulosa TaxID=1460663 RepID=A0A177CGT1_9PLEO|nr:exo-polygalacturonase [Paraphaeosphaeria sporulosa]OAG06774.1 exo-polygalacturonase [Paraphaeosphaeria sporulosa]